MTNSPWRGGARNRVLEEQGDQVEEDVKRRCVMKRVTVLSLVGIMVIAMLLLLPMEANAIPVFSRLYGYKCGACHSAFPALNSAGEEFRLSGYRRFEGGDVVPEVPPVKIGDRLELPGIVPLSFSLRAGYNFTEINNTLGDGSKNTNTADDFKRSQSSFNLSEFEFLAGASLGSHLSFFLDFPLGETEIRQFFDPEVRTHGTKSTLEGPDVPMLAFIGFHDILLPDLLNLKGGVFELPTAFSPEHRRLSFFPYLVYEATSLDVVARKGIDDFVSVPGVDEEGLERNQFRLSKTQIGIQLFGRVTPSLHQIPDLYMDYFVGVVNGNNVNPDNNKTKDVFGRLAFAYITPYTYTTIGGFGYYSGNTLDNLTTNPDSSARYKNRLWRYGPDVSFTVVKPLYVSLYSQILFGEDSNATGFGKKVSWWGGFAGADIKPINELVLYGRYDWIDGDRFDDTSVAIFNVKTGENVSGTIGPVKPRLWDVVVGAQYFLYENFKLIAEYRHGEKDLGSVPSDVDQLKKTKEEAVFGGFQLVF